MCDGVDAETGEHRKSFPGRQGYVIKLGHLKVRIASPCVGALLQILSKRVGIYPYFIKRNGKVRELKELLELRPRPDVCYHTPILNMFVSLTNGSTASQEGVGSSFMTLA